VADLKT
jgi:hypothetical protein